MKPAALIALALALAPAAALAAPVTYVPSPVGPTGVAPPFSRAVMAGDTLYLSGTTDGGAKLGGTAADAAKRVMDNLKGEVEAGGLTMNDLVWVQIFAADLGDYAAFNEVYRTYFTGPMPTRAFIGAGHLLGDAHFEVMGVAVRKSK
ncbi:RidA family protein [Phenylobacterium aquaticum]|uniref:RidA family protein n=1 Tax=Phenylobacterium aquaticum TaxID=1763816 RepID=UPI001F5CCF8E|nr:Rid family hydrolase [Phenylobacterium aquaticum]MCI3132482.1 Rid family hydrolase [Phenylobacterium aquaticum]